ncbi:MAG: c-type cytochrome [Pseudomonadota bacterium]
MSLKKKLVVAAVLFLLPMAVHAEGDDHKGEEKKNTGRLSAEKKKPATLSEKISACLAERPASTKTDGSAKHDPKDLEPIPFSSTTASPTTKAAGAALFEQFCSRCHSNGVSGGKAVGKLTSSQMPPADEPQPSAQEKQALIEYFSGQK